MAANLPWLSYEREDGVSKFAFTVPDVDRSFAAVRDVKGLINAGGGPLNVWLLPYTQINMAFAAIGFPPRKPNKELQVHVEGAAGEVGARYSYTFDYGTRQDTFTDQTETIFVRVEMEIGRIVDEFGRKEVVLNSSVSVSGHPNSCFCTKGFKPQTMTSFEFTPNDRGWNVTMSHDGYDPVDAVDYESCCGFVTRMVLITAICPILIPLFPFVLHEERYKLHKHLPEQLTSIRDYMNLHVANMNTHGDTHYHRAPRVVRPPEAVVVEDEKGEKGEVGVAVAVVESDVEEDTAAKLEKWHRLYKNGAITLDEYEGFKAKLLKDADI